MGWKHGVEERKLKWPLFHFKMLDTVLTRLWNVWNPIIILAHKGHTPFTSRLASNIEQFLPHTEYTR